MTRKIRVYSENHLYNFTITAHQPVSFDLITPGKPVKHVGEAILENEEGNTIRASYHDLGGLFGHKLVERHIVVLRRLGGKEKNVYQIPQWVGQLDLNH